MGVDAIDYDGDGWKDLFVANVDQQSFSLYHNRKDPTFEDQAAEISKATRMLTGWDCDSLITTTTEIPTYSSPTVTSSP